jgi:hypothetical protein
MADQELKMILESNRDPLLREVIGHPEIYRYQIIYTRIDRTNRNKPSSHNYYLNVDSLEYFNPASTLKMPLALLSLEKMNAVRVYSYELIRPRKHKPDLSAFKLEYKKRKSDGGPVIREVDS